MDVVSLHVSLFCYVCSVVVLHFMLYFWYNTYLDGKRHLRQRVDEPLHERQVVLAPNHLVTNRRHHRHHDHRVCDMEGSVCVQVWGRVRVRERVQFVRERWGEASCVCVCVCQ